MENLRIVWVVADEPYSQSLYILAFHSLLEFADGLVKAFGVYMNKRKTETGELEMKYCSKRCYQLLKQGLEMSTFLDSEYKINCKGSRMERIRQLQIVAGRAIPAI